MVNHVILTTSDSVDHPRRLVVVFAVHRREGENVQHQAALQLRRCQTWYVFRYVVRLFICF